MIPIRDIIPAEKTPFVTWFIILLNAAVFIFELTLLPSERAALFNAFGLVPAKIAAEKPYETGVFGYLSFFTNMFLHGGWSHFIMNMWALWIFADNVEDMMGHFRFFLFYILSGFLASLAHFVIYMNSNIPAIGASGALAGVMAAYMRLFPSSRIITLVPIFFYPLIFEVPAVLYIGLWFIMQLISGTAILASQPGKPGIAFWAHIGGFIAGFITHRFFLIRTPKKNK
ncbi:MAG: rhomboid family intramembrane serine protease [Spirochaetia bacterium]|nr:rhomboid family intramembrane serine protease [Spirochaetia bacterium]